MGLFQKQEEKKDTKPQFPRLTDGQLRSLEVEVNECGGRDAFLVKKQAVRFEKYGSGMNMIILRSPDGSFPYSRLMNSLEQLDYYLALRQEEEDMRILKETGIDPQRERMHKVRSLLKKSFALS